MFEALASKRRRIALWFIADSEGDSVSLDKVSEHLAATTDAAVDTIRVSLHYQHLPKLESAGVVEYDERSGAIRYRNSECIATLRKTTGLDCIPA